MRALLTVAVVCALCAAVAGCKSKKREPVPGPQVAVERLMAPFAGSSGRSSGSTTGSAEEPSRGPDVHLGVTGGAGGRASDSGASGREQPSADTHKRAEKRRRGADGIAWFQGSVDEAFARPGPC